MARLVAVAGLALCAMLRPLAAADPVVHILVQLPLLAAAGWLLAPPRRPDGVTAAALLVVAVSGVLVWMLPRSIDAAVASPWLDVLKFLTIPLLVGAPLRWAWPHLHPILRGVVKAQTVSMLGVLGFLYTHAPVRICNAYLTEDQTRLGFGFLIVAALLAAAWSWPVLTGRPLGKTDDVPKGRWQAL